MQNKHSTWKFLGYDSSTTTIKNLRNLLNHSGDEVSLSELRAATTTEFYSEYKNSGTHYVLHKILSYLHEKLSTQRERLDGDVAQRNSSINNTSIGGGNL